MSYQEATKRLAEHRKKITAIRQDMLAIQASLVPEAVADYVFGTTQGPANLSSLFGNKADLFVIHNMGASCPYCTLWADGYNGVYEHLADRAAFVVSSPDEPAKQDSFAKSRRWHFPMVSHRGTTFANDMGYLAGNGGCLPGISAFKRDGEQILRVSDQQLGPGDPFCSVWHFLDMLPEGAAGWAPKFSYARGES